MPSISNYVCAKCEMEMRPEKNGVYVEEHIENSKPYKIWMAELLKCPTCGMEVIGGFGMNPVAHHLHPSYIHFQEQVEYHIR